MNLDDLFAVTARRQPQRPALLGPGPQEVVSYGALDQAIGQAAQRLAQAGLRPGDTVGLHFRSGADYIRWTYAVWRCGGCVVPLAVELTAEEKTDICRTIALRFVLNEHRPAGFLERLAAQSPVELPGAALVPLAGPCDHPPGFAEVNAAFLRFTSGTTAAAKGVVLSHETVLERIRAANDVLHIGPETRVLWLLSMSYHFTVSIVSYLTHGAAVVLVPNAFAPAMLAAARDFQATLIYAAPVHYVRLADAAGGALPDLRLAISTTAALDPAVAHRFQERYGRPVAQALGIIEIGLPFINLDTAADQPGAVGRALPAYRVRLEDIGLGSEQGEVLLSGPGILDAYYQPWRPRAQIMPNGWFRTGDIGTLDANGCLVLRGRNKDMISVLGLKFFPQEVEAVLKSHPQVEDACVFAQTDARLGEVPCAEVVAKPGGPAPSARELRDHCRRVLADFKVPEHIALVSSLRQTASGKILHRRATP
jgi:long-chain acyl-CoA synthetase